MKKYLLGVDLGTSSCKTVLFSLNGAIVSTASMEYETTYGSSREVEQVPRHWWKAVCKTIQDILKTGEVSPSDILAVGLDTQSSAFIPMDKDGNVLHNALIWTDHRATAQQQWLEEHVSSDMQEKINGNRFNASNVGTKALWWKQTHPEEYEKTAAIVNACGYLVYQLTGKYSCNFSEADLSQLSDQKRETWSEQLFDAYMLDIEKFPPIYYGDQIVGSVTEAASAETGLAIGTPVTAGAMDVCATALGSSVCKPGDAVITGGTVTGIALCNDSFVLQETAHVYHHMLRNQWIYCASVDFGGGSLRWFRDQFMDGYNGTENLYNVMDQMAKKIPCGSDGLIFLPYMVGQRCPEWDSNMTGVFFGLRPQHTKSHCIRSIMEGTAFGVAKIAQLFERDGLKIHKLMLAGGCTKSDVWMDIYSQVLAQSNLYRSESKELAALGAAIGAGIAAGVYSGVEEGISVCDVKKVVYPPHDRDRYERTCELFQSLYPALKDSFRTLNSITDLS